MQAPDGFFEAVADEIDRLAGELDAGATPEHDDPFNRIIGGLRRIRGAVMRREMYAAEMREREP